MAFYDRYWEMQKGGPYEEGTKIFKCKDCGAETIHPQGWDGEPDVSGCMAGCPARYSDWKAGGVSRQYRENFDRIFPFSPGAGL